MHLIAPLSSGTIGAEDGTAVIRQRGTATLARLYSTFEGTVLTQPTTGLLLDANGGAEVYVNELVDVVVRDTTGTAVREFTAGDAAPNVEVRSAAFTGTAYTGGAQAAGNPTTLQAVADLWLTQNGAIDWKVLLGGASVTVQAALAGIYGIFINVKDPTYGAVGDGVTNDTTAVQAALTAAGSLTTPGIVFFPAGAYRITSKLTVPVDVSLWGNGAARSILYMDHATADTLEYGSGTATGYQEIRNLQMYAAQDNSGKPISITNAGARRVMLVNSAVNVETSRHYKGTLVSIDGTSHEFVADSSTLIINGAGVYGIQAQNTSQIVVRGNTSIYVSAISYSGAAINGVNIDVSNSQILLTLVTGGTYYAIALFAGQAPTVRVHGSRLEAGAGTSYGIYSVGLNYAGTQVAESGNTFYGFSAPYVGLTSGSARPRIQTAARDTFTYSVTDNSATVSVPSSTYGMVVVTRDGAGAGAQTITASSGGPEGSFLTISIYNASGGALAGAVSFTTGFTATVPTVTPANGKVSTYVFRQTVIAGSGAWTPVSASVTTT